MKRNFNAYNITHYRPCCASRFAVTGGGFFLEEPHMEVMVGATHTFDYRVHVSELLVSFFFPTAMILSVIMILRIKIATLQEAKCLL